MKLHEIIEHNNTKGTTVLWERMHPYKKMLYTYYKREFCCEPVLLVDSVFNAAQYVKIVPSDNFNEEVLELIGYDDIEDNFDAQCQFENINFNSKMLKQCL